MIIVHDTFVCKPGNAGKYAKIFKEIMKDVEVLTDMTGQFHRIIMVSKYKNLADYEKSFKMRDNPSKAMQKAMEKMKDFHENYTSGSREIYKVW